MESGWKGTLRPVRLWLRAATPRAVHAMRLLNPQIRWTKSSVAAQGAGSGAGRGALLPGLKSVPPSLNNGPGLILALRRPAPPRPPPPPWGAGALGTGCRGAGGWGREQRGVRLWQRCCPSGPRDLAWLPPPWLPPGFLQVLERGCGAASPAVSRTPLVFFSVSFSLKSLISRSRPLSVAVPAPAPCPSPTTAGLGCAPPTDHQLAEEETGQLSRVQAPPRCQKRAEGREGETESAHCPRRLTVAPRVGLLSWESLGPEPWLAGLPHLAAQATAPTTPRRDGPPPGPPDP